MQNYIPAVEFVVQVHARHPSSGALRLLASGHATPELPDATIPYSAPVLNEHINLLTIFPTP